MGATAEAASNLANVLFSLCLLFNGVLVGPNAMPGFWIFMYRVSPFTYLVEGLLGNGVTRQTDNLLPHRRERTRTGPLRRQHQKSPRRSPLCRILCRPRKSSPLHHSPPSKRRRSRLRNRSSNRRQK